MGGVTWVASLPADPLWFDSGRDRVLYHRPSGQTHLVNESASLLLFHALVEPKNVTTLTSELASMQQVAPSEDLRSYVEDLLLRLEDLGLVQRA
jgi:PqqD family protein of HPr-rel-A system